jgi:hypothetical protein
MVKMIGATAGVLAVLSIVACEAESAEDSDAADSNLDGASLMCVSKPQARSYKHFDGTLLEEKRADESVDANRARFKPFAVIGDEYKRVLGTTPRSLAGASATFDDPPARWFAETALSGVALTAVYGISLEGCAASMATDPARATAPTADTATTYCKDTMQNAWGVPPTADEVATCVTLATTKLSGESDAKKRWAHVCASILTSSQFLTF